MDLDFNALEELKKFFLQTEEETGDGLPLREVRDQSGPP